ncbi:MAG: DNA-binding winged helix-turn-helix (wHTH) protein [Oceanicoccus sp.]|jgi:DNA-binding winged helix-turn-helix (wHTH) protein
MQSIIISTRPLNAVPIHDALKRLNVDSICARPLALNGWKPETDAIIFLDAMPTRYFPHLAELLDELPYDVPLISMNPLSNEFTHVFKNSLDRFVILSDQINLEDSSLLILDLMIQAFDGYQEELTCGPITMNKRNRSLQVFGRSISLTKKEFYLMELLTRNLGKTTTRERIVDYVWGRRQFVASNTIDVYISRIRKKLPHGEFSPSIKTIPCLGYSLQLNSQLNLLHSPLP